MVLKRLIIIKGGDLREGEENSFFNVAINGYVFLLNLWGSEFSGVFLKEKLGWPPFFVVATQKFTC